LDRLFRRDIPALFLYRYESYAKNEAAKLVRIGGNPVGPADQGAPPPDPINPSAPGYQALKRTLMLFRSETADPLRLPDLRAGRKILFS
jgi:hypothetical protein